MTLRMLIDGELRSGSSELDVINPATEAVLERAARASEADLLEAVAAAKRAFPAWSALSWSERREFLNRLADAMEARSDEFARLLTAEQGRPLEQARGEVAGAIGCFRFFSANELAPVTLVDEPDSLVTEYYAPLGVVAVITPWNFPLVLVSVKTACALATGNTVVAKPAPTTPLTTLLLGEIAASILPKGVFNTIVDSNDLGGTLSGHPDVAKITFTGSTGTGRKVMQNAATSIKRVTLELGGNDVAILMDDVDIDGVAQLVFNAATFNAGQVCTAAKRIYAPRRLYDRVCDALVAEAAKVVVGDGSEPASMMGPLQNKAQFEKVLGYIEDSRARGKIIAGGDRLNRPGYFIPPTIVRDLPDDAPLVREEQFGPVFPVLAYDDLDDLVTRANDSDYGLAGTIWGTNLESATELARRIDTGTVWINKHLDLRPDVPFGGAKQSGLGREQGEDGLKEFVQSRIISVAR